MRFSAFIRDPFVRAAFERAERDHGNTFAIPDAPPLVLDGGAAELAELDQEADQLEFA